MQCAHSGKITPHCGSYLPRNEGIRTEHDKYVRWIDFEGSEEYFDLVKDPKESQSLNGQSGAEERIRELRESFLQWRAENPSNYEYVKNGIPRFSSEDIDWELFEDVAPQHYLRIKAAIERLGVTWEQAEQDWDIRYQVCKEARFWY